MALDQLPAFMNAIAQLESGGNPNALGPQTSTYGRAQGMFQIMEQIWPSWAREAGIPGADPWDPKAQEHVARHKMTQYYNRYGSWDLVAVAWFAGPGRANQAAEQGIRSVGGISDVLGTDVSTYVSKVMSTMSDPIQSTDSTTAMARRRQMSNAGLNELASDEEYVSAQERFVEGRRASTQTMADIFSTASEFASRRDKVVDAPEMFGFVEDDTLGETEDETHQKTVGVR